MAMTWARERERQRSRSRETEDGVVLIFFWDMVMG